MAFDPFLRHVVSSFPHIVTRAYADDTGMVIEDTKDIPRIARLFHEYGKASGGLGSTFAADVLSFGY